MCQSSVLCVCVCACVRICIYVHVWMCMCWARVWISITNQNGPESNFAYSGDCHSQYLFAEMIEEATKHFPSLSRTIIDERDMYLSHTYVFALFSLLFYSLCSMSNESACLYDSYHVSAAIRPLDVCLHFNSLAPPVCACNNGHVCACNNVCVRLLPLFFCSRLLFCVR